MRERKQEVLTHKTPAISYGIADAVVIKDGDLFFLCEPNGDVPLRPGHGFGLFFRDCRYLSGFEVRLARKAGITLLNSTLGSHEALFVMTNPRLSREQDQPTEEETIGVTWKRLLSGERCALIETLQIRNYGLRPAEVPLSMAFQASFEDIFQLRGLLNERPGKLHPPDRRDDGVDYLYEGADGVYRSLLIRWSIPVAAWQDDKAHFLFRLGPDEGQELNLTLTVSERPSLEEAREHRGSVEVLAPSDEHDRAFEVWQQRHTRIKSDSLLLDRIIQRGEQDLHTLRSQLRGKVYFAAGIPWFSTLFGRDSLIACLQNLAFDQQVAEDTLRLLAEFQGQKVDEWRDEQPGKILHEYRVGELASTGAIPHTPYYGSVDATPLFLILLAQHARWSGQLGLFEELRPHVERSLEWIDRYADLTGDGYVDYDSSVGEGLINQGWKDSGNAILNRDGSLAEPPISLVEVQAYVYGAKVAIAELFERAGDDARGQRLRAEAKALRARFNRDFWLAEEKFLALALQKGRRPVRIVSSNPGHALWAGIVDEDKARCVVERLMAPDMYSGWGIRTISENEYPYNPIGYHLGTVWPHDNAIIAGGMKRYGFDQEVERLFEGMFEAASKFEEYQVPELFAGYSREFAPVPVSFPVACHPQAWGAGTIPYMLWSMLGLHAEALDGRLRILRPRLPRLLRHLEIHHMQVGSAYVDLRFEREGDRTHVAILAQEGDLEVSVET
jgi:glycogen debranching enzyme